ncbi:MAG TPA: MBL fold metallo-hydrolase [Bacillota bacterium]
MMDNLGIKMITMPLPFRLNHVNCFIGEGEEGWVIMDTGLHNETTQKMWEQHIETEQVTDIWLTHYHPDHYGYAGSLQEKTEARVSMTKRDAELGNKAWKKRFMNHVRTHYGKHGIPSAMANQMIENTREFVERVTPHPRVDHYFTEGEVVQFGKYTYEIIFTPGHSDGLICLYNKEKKVLFSTDHILPKITPNISYWFHGDSNPLQTYLQSLEKVKRLDAQYVIPSHGKPFYGANERIEEIVDHHEERLHETLEIIQKQDVTVYEACQHLFPKSLTIHEQRFAIGETLAHLDYLRYAGECQREWRNGLWFYVIV